MTFTPAYYDGHALNDVANAIGVSRTIKYGTIIGDKNCSPSNFAFYFAVLVLDSCISEQAHYWGYNMYHTKWWNGEE